MSGLPEKFRAGTYRQKYAVLPGDKVEVTLSAALPVKRVALPLADPSGGKNLETTNIYTSLRNEEMREAMRAVEARLRQ